AVFPDAEGQIGHEAPGMGDRRIRERLADDAHAHAAHLADRVRMEDVVPPPRDGHVVGNEVAVEETASLPVTEELLDAVEAVDELPVRGGDLDAELVGDLNHVLAAAPQGGRSPL